MKVLLLLSKKLKKQNKKQKQSAFLHHVLAFMVCFLFLKLNKDLHVFVTETFRFNGDKM